MEGGRLAACALSIVAIACGRVSFDAVARDAPDAGIADGSLADSGGPTCVVFTDDFEDGIRGPEWVDAASTPPLTVSEVDGHLAIGLAEGLAGSAYGGYAVPPRDFTGLAMEVEVTEVPNAATAGQLLFTIRHGDITQFVIESGWLVLRHFVGAVFMDVLEMPHDAIAHRFLRLASEPGGILTFYTSANGVDWMRHVSVDAPDLTEARISLEGGTYRAETAPGFVGFDDFVLRCN